MRDEFVIKRWSASWDEIFSLYTISIWEGKCYRILDEFFPKHQKSINYALGLLKIFISSLMREHDDTAIFAVEMGKNN